MHLYRSIQANCVSWFYCRKEADWDVEGGGKKILSFVWSHFFFCNELMFMFTIVMIQYSSSYVAVLKSHDQRQLKGESLFWFMAPERKSTSWSGSMVESNRQAAGNSCP